MSVFLFFGYNTSAQTIETFNSPGAFSYTVPCGVTSITVEVWGAGGAGGGSTDFGGGGGGSGCYSTQTISVSPGQIISYTVGAGGVGNLAGNGTDGTSSSFAAVTAAGGFGGLLGTSTPGPQGLGCSAGDLPGNDGFAGNSTNGGDGGSAPNGGAGGNGGGVLGLNGNIPGAGGGGGKFDGITQGTGGNGASGQIRLTYTINNPTITADGPLSFCSGSSVNLTSSAAPSYLWSTGETTQTINVNNSGVYNVTIVDGSCTLTSASVTVTSNPIPAAPVIDSITQPTCNTNGTVYFSNLPSTGSWEIEESVDNNRILGTGTTGSFPNLDPNVYTFTVVSDAGCASDPSLDADVLFPFPQGPVLETAFDIIYCFGDSTAYIDVTIGGGTDPVTFVWSNGSTTLNQTGLSAGTYSITATDANGCTASATIDITEPATPLSLNIIENDILCFGGTPGYAFANVSGGTPMYFYSWSNGEFTAANNNLSPGVYSVTVYDSNGCEASESVTITGPSAPLTLNIDSQTNTICFGDAGSATVSAAGGTGSYIYDWSDGQFSQTATGLIAGVYTVSVTDDNACVTETDITITGPSAALTTTLISKIDVSCNGDNTGEISVSVAGGTPSYNYIWNNGQTDLNISALNAGVFTISVTDFNGCQTVENYTITEPSLPLSQSLSQTGVLCFGETNGTASSVASGGVGPYIFQWSTGSTAASISNLVAGVYTVTATDNNLCTDISSVTVSGPTIPLDLTLDSQTDIICFGETGTATVSATGGIGSYFFEWSDGQIGNSAVGLLAGNYQVSVTDDNGCVDTLSVFISGPSSALSAIISSQNNVLCFAQSSGSATVQAAGGSGSYNYSWNTSPVQNTITATGLSAGNYTVTISDANGCTQTVNSTVTITQPNNALSVNISLQTDNLCFGESNASASANATGGSGVYNYIWSNGQTNAIATGLATASYTVTVSDANGCTINVIDNVTINGPSSALSASISSQTNVLCFGESSGSASVTASGGSGTYNYIWSNGQTDLTSTGLTAAVYNVTISDANGCSLTELLTVTISEPSTALNASITSQTNVLCFGESTGSANVTASGGSGSYNYIWSNGQTNALATGLTSGISIVSVSDANGCTVVAIDSITITEPSSSLISSISSQTDILCFGQNNGAATVSPNGGSGTYIYQWSTGQTDASIFGLSAGTYTVTVSDANGCTSSIVNNVTISSPSSTLTSSITSQTNILCFGDVNGTATVTPSGGSGAYVFLWSNGQTTSSASTLGIGIHSVTVSDFNGCTVNSISSVTITGPGSPLSSSISSQTDILCFGEATGTATVAASGGTGSYNYIWNTVPLQGSSTASGLTAGVYSVTVSDQNGCTASINSTVTISQPSAPLSAFVSGQTNVLCFSETIGNATISASGGSGTFNYLWNTLPVQTTATATGLGVGNYNVTVSDANGCTSTVVTLNVNITGPTSPLSASVFLQNNVVCFGENTGAVSLTASGGSGLYNYLWSSGQTIANIGSLAAGPYTVTVTDQNGCTVNAVANITVTGPSSPLTASISAQSDVLCFGAANGSATVNVLGGSGSYLYSWSTSPVQNSATAIALNPGIYTVTVSDLNGCTITETASVTINGPSSVLSVASTNSSDVLCFGGADGTASVLATGGSGSYNYQWSNAQTTSTATGLTSGIYSVTITDTNGCPISVLGTVNVGGPAAVVSASILTQSDVLCFGESNGSVTLNPTGGSGAYSYLWSTTPAQNTVSATGLGAGIYTVTVTDLNGCTITGSTTVTITEPGLPLSVNISSQTDVLCFNEATGNATASAIGGTANYNYLWSTVPSQNTNIVSALSSGIYTVTVTDNNGCTASVTTTITEPSSAPTASIVSFSDVFCFGDSSGSATVAAVGGTGAYNYIWSNGETNLSVSGLNAGTYFVTVFDSNGCNSLDSVEISQPTSAVSIISSSFTNVTCNGGTDGSISIVSTGGVPNYGYLWSNAATTSSQTAISAGIYTVTVTDANNCAAVASLTVSEPPVVGIPVLDSVQQTNCVSSVGNIYLSGLPSGLWVITDATNGNTYTGNTNSTIISSLSPGTYSFYVTNSSGCFSDTTVIITINNTLALDCDGDGVSNGDEIADATDINDPCDYIQTSITLTQGGLWADTDCDGDGVINANETIDATDIFDPCSYNSISITLTQGGAWSSLDCDGDGVVNSAESIDGTDPLNPCEFIATSASVSPSTAWNNLDCDGDGVTNSNELTDGTDIFDPCSYILGSVTLTPSAIWNNADCDGDGVINITELNDGTNPANSCNFNSASITLPQGGIWNAFDCDGDGVLNGTEISDGTDPYDFCSFIFANITEPLSSAFNSADCDGDGVLNSSEILDGTNVQDPCDYLPTSVINPQSSAWNNLDCDGDGVSNGTEIIDGTNALDPCSYLISSITLSQGGNWSSQDCDGDGVLNGVEIIDATDPQNSCSFLTSSITFVPSAAWNSSDCDGDGVTNGNELTEGTDILDPCSFNLNSVTLTPGGSWNLEDCDGDGVINGTEIVDGTDPSNPCSFNSTSITLSPSSSWNIVDCDGDGVINGVEISDGTDPDDPCSYLIASVTETQGGTWNSVDCDGDGVINGTEVTDGTNPENPCSYFSNSITVVPSSLWDSVDCDGDGVVNITELYDATDPNNPCSFNESSVTLVQGGLWNTSDCDGDGVTNATEIADSTDPANFCSYLIASASLPVSIDWQSSDCDGDGVSNSTEITDNTDPQDPCNYILNSVTLIQGGIWSAADCDGDGVINGIEITDITNPEDPCSFVLASQTESPSSDWNEQDCDNDGISNGDEIAQSTDPLDECSPRSCDLNIPEGFSPNNDGVNDTYIIRALHLYPNNSLQIFNRWGNIVYKSEPYLNDWDGRSTKGVRIGEELPTGVYFYLLDLGDGNKPMKGYIYLNREN